MGLHTGAAYVGADVFNRLGRHDVVARCYGFWAGHAFRAPPYYRRFHEPAVATARASLGATEFERVAAEGARMTSDEFVDTMLEAIDELLAGMPPE